MIKLKENEILAISTFLLPVAENSKLWKFYTASHKKGNGGTSVSPGKHTLKKKKKTTH